MYAALGALASGAPGNDGSNDDPAAQKCARGTADYLLGAYRNEANEEARASILAALGLWVAREGGAAVAAAVPFYNDGLKEKDLVRRSHLKSLRTAIQSNSFRSACGPLAGSLLALVKAGAAKPTQRLDGVLALLLLVRMAASDAAVDEKLAKERVWQLVLQKESPLLSQAAAAKLLLEEAPVLVELVTVILTQHPSRVAENAADASDLFQARTRAGSEPAMAPIVGGAACGGSHGRGCGQAPGSGALGRRHCLAAPAGGAEAGGGLGR
eukprot:SM001622S02342  [mRNA]  locus=s1622:69:1889:- [translate_table: standard]